MSPDVLKVLETLCTEMEAQTIVMEVKLAAINSMDFNGTAVERVNQEKEMLKGQLTLNTVMIAGIKERIKKSQAEVKPCETK